MKKLLSICFLSMLLVAWSFTARAQSTTNCCFWLQNMHPDTLFDIANVPGGIAALPGHGGVVVLDNNLNPVIRGNYQQTDVYKVRFCNTCGLPGNTKVSLEWKLYKDGQLVNGNLADYADIYIYTRNPRFNNEDFSVNSGLATCGRMSYMGGKVSGDGVCYRVEDHINLCRGGYPGAYQPINSDPRPDFFADGSINIANGLALDYFYLSFFEATEHYIQIKWKQVGNYSLVVGLRERSGGTYDQTLYWQDIDAAGNQVQNTELGSIGGHQSCCEGLLAQDSIYYPVPPVNRMKAICDGDSYIYGSPAASFTVQGQYNVVFGETLCDGSDCGHFRVDSLVILDFFTRINPEIEVRDVTLCQGEPFTADDLFNLATAHDTDAPGAIGYHIEWLQADGSYSEIVPTPSTAVPGTYEYWVRQTNDYDAVTGENFSCSGPAKLITMTVNPILKPIVELNCFAFCNESLATTALTLKAENDPDNQCNPVLRWYFNGTLVGEGDTLAVDLASLNTLNIDNTVTYIVRAETQYAVSDDEVITINFFHTPEITLNPTQTEFLVNPNEVVTLDCAFEVNPPEAAGASLNVTVAEGTSTNQYVPFRGFYADEFSRSQVVYPASMLTDLIGKKVSKMTFYTRDNVAVDWHVNFQASIGEVSYTEFPSSNYFEPMSSLTNVYTGSLTAADGKFVVTFDQPYEYNGGNLLFDLQNTTQGDYEEVYFNGIVTTATTALYGSNPGSVNYITALPLRVIPQTTFELVGDATVNSQMSYTWTKNGVAISDVACPLDVHAPSACADVNPDVYEVTITATTEREACGDIYTCSSTATRTYTVKARTTEIELVAEPTEICAGEDVTLTLTVTNPAEPLTLDWSANVPAPAATGFAEDFNIEEINRCSTIDGTTDSYFKWNDWLGRDDSGCLLSKHGLTVAADDQSLVVSNFGISSTSTLKFWTKVAGGTEHCAVYVVNSGDALTSPVATYDINSTNWEEKVVDLSAFAGQTKDIVIRHYNSPAGFNYLAFDDITISGAGAFTPTAITTSTVALEENFETAGTVELVDQDADGSNWTRKESAAAHTGSFYMVSDLFDLDNTTSDNWFITNAFVVPTNATLNFFVKGVASSLNNYGVYVLTEGQTVTEGTSISEEAASNPDWAEANVDLAAYSGQNIRLAFRHYNSAIQAALAIDDITVTSGVTEPALVYTVTVQPTEGTNTYKVTVIDANGCEKIDSVKVTGFHVPETADATLAQTPNTYCYTDFNVNNTHDGTISVVFNHSDIAYYKMNSDSVWHGVDYVYTGLPAGTYTFDLKTIHECISYNIVTIDVNDELFYPVRPDATLKCNTYCDRTLGADGAIAIAMLEGYEYQVVHANTDGSYTVLNVNTEVRNDSIIFSKLRDDEYTVRVISNKYCVAYHNFTIEFCPDLPRFVGEITTLNQRNCVGTVKTDCGLDTTYGYNGSIIIVEQTGFLFTVYNAATNVIIPVADWTKLPAGSYKIRKTNTLKGCYSDTTVTIIDELVRPLIEIEGALDRCVGETVTAIGSATPVGLYHYYWTTDCQGLICSDTLSWTPLREENCRYTFTAINLETGCIADTTGRIVIHGAPDINFLINDVAINGNEYKDCMGAFPVKVGVEATNLVDFVWSYNPSYGSYILPSTLDSTGEECDYCVTVTDIYGCTNNDCIHVAVINDSIYPGAVTLCANPDATFKGRTYSFVPGATNVVVDTFAYPSVRFPHCDSLEIWTITLMQAPSITNKIDFTQKICAGTHYCTDANNSVDIVWNNTETSPGAHWGWERENGTTTVPFDITMAIQMPQNGWRVRATVTTTCGDVVTPWYTINVCDKPEVGLPQYKDVLCENAVLTLDALAINWNNDVTPNFGYQIRYAATEPFVDFTNSTALTYHDYVEVRGYAENQCGRAYSASQMITMEELPTLTLASNSAASYFCKGGVATIVYNTNKDLVVTPVPFGGAVYDAATVTGNTITIPTAGATVNPTAAPTYYEYEVKTVLGNCGTRIDRFVITLIDKPVINTFGTPTQQGQLYCVGDAMNLTVNTSWHGRVDYSEKIEIKRGTAAWETISNPYTVRAGDNGAVVRYTVTNNCGSDQSQFTLKVSEPVTVTNFDNVQYDICRDANVTIGSLLPVPTYSAVRSDDTIFVGWVVNGTKVANPNYVLSADATVSYRVQTSCGSYDNNDVHVTVHYAPVVVLRGGNFNVCENSTISLPSTSITNTHNEVYKWYVTVGGTTTVFNPATPMTMAYNGAKVKFEVKNVFGSVELDCDKYVSSEYTIVVDPMPTLTITSNNAATQLCKSERIEVGYTSNKEVSVNRPVDAPALTPSISTSVIAGLGVTGTVTAASTTPTAYTYTVTTLENGACPAATANFTVNLIDKPQVLTFATAAGNTHVYCVGDELDAAGTQNWFGNVGTTQITITRGSDAPVAIAADYAVQVGDNDAVVRYTATNDCGSDYKEFALKVAEPVSIASLGASPVYICDGSAINTVLSTPAFINNIHTIIQNQGWSINGSKTLYTGTTTITADCTIEYVVETQCGRYTSSPVQMLVRKAPSVAISAHMNCVNEPLSAFVSTPVITPGANSTILSQGWLYGSTPIATSDIVTTNMNGVRYFVRTECGTYYSNDVNIVVSPYPTPVIAPVAAQCYNASSVNLTVTNSTANSTFSWSVNGTDNVSTAYPYALPIAATDTAFNVTVTQTLNASADFAGCSTTSAPIRFEVIPEVTISNITAGTSCKGSELSEFVAVPSYSAINPAYILDEGWTNGTISYDLTDVVNANIIGLKYFVTTSCGTAYSNGVDLVLDHEIIDVPEVSCSTTSIDICEAGEVTTAPALTINEHGSATTTVWSIDGTTVTFPLTMDKNYDGKTLKAVVTNDCGKDSIAIALTVHPLPIPEFTGDAELCPTGSKTLTVSPVTAGSTYEWFLEDGTSVGTGASYIVDASSLATDNIYRYYVVETDAYGCVSATRKNMDVAPAAWDSEYATITVTSAPRFTFLYNGAETHEIDGIQTSQTETTSFDWMIGNDCGVANDQLVFVTFKVYRNGELIPDNQLGSYLKPVAVNAYQSSVMNDVLTYEYSVPAHPTFEMTTNYAAADGAPYGSHFPMVNGVSGVYLYDDYYLHFLNYRPVHKTLQPFTQNGEYKIVFELFSTSNVDVHPYEYYNGTENMTVGGQNSVSGGAIITRLSMDSIYINVTGENLIPAMAVAPATAPAAEITSEPTMNVYPNPAVNVVNAEINGLTGRAMIQIVNTVGVVVAQEEVEIPATGYFKYTTSLEAYSNGIYFINVINDDKKITRKVVVTK